MDWETLVRDYTNAFIEKGIDESVAKAMAEMLADTDMDIYRAFDRDLGAQCLDGDDGKTLDRLFIPNFDEDIKQ